MSEPDGLPINHDLSSDGLADHLRVFRGDPVHSDEYDPDAIGPAADTWIGTAPVCVNPEAIGDPDQTPTVLVPDNLRPLFGPPAVP